MLDINSQSTSEWPNLKKYSAFLKDNPEITKCSDVLKTLPVPKNFGVYKDIETKDFEVFRRTLLNCTDVAQVIQQVEIFSDEDIIAPCREIKVLKHICHLVENTSYKDLWSFVRGDLLLELLSLAGENTSSVTTGDLLQIIKCSSCNIQEFNKELIMRIIDGTLSVPDICCAISIYSDAVCDTKVWKCLWKHLEQRLDQDVNETNIVKVFESIFCLDSQRKRDELLKKVAALVQQHIYKMSHDDIAFISVLMTVVNYKSPKMLRSISLWLYQSGNTVSSRDLQCILLPFVYFKTKSIWLLKRLSREYVEGGDFTTNRALHVMVIDYLQSIRYCSPIVIEAILQDFVKNGKCYSDRYDCG